MHRKSTSFEGGKQKADGATGWLCNYPRVLVKQPAARDIDESHVHTKDTVPHGPFTLDLHPNMNQAYERLRWSPNFVKQFGLWSGLRLLLQIVKGLPRSSSRVSGFNVPGYSAKVYLRETIADHATFKQCIVTNQYDFLQFPQAARLKETYQAFLTSGVRPLIIDAGANIGLATLWFAKHFPEAQIVAIEPDDNNFALLRRNTRHLGDNVLLIQGGVWYRSARLGILNPSAGAAAFRVGEISEGTAGGVPAYAVDDICALVGNASPLIVKLDIEGSQAQIFSSNTDWVSRTSLITLELDDWLFPWQGTSHNFFRCLSNYPFDYLLHKESIFCFRNDRASEKVSAA